MLQQRGERGVSDTGWIRKSLQHEEGGAVLRVRGREEGRGETEGDQVSVRREGILRAN